MQVTKSREILLDEIQEVNDFSFDDVAMDVFFYQYQHNITYQEYVNNLVGKENVPSLSEPVYLPIESFKNYSIKSSEWDEKIIFTSSGTTGNNVSKHFVRDEQIYLQSCKQNWEEFYGKISDYCYLCLLPGYMEREGSSLIKMMNYFVKSSNYESGFYLHNHADLFDRLTICKQANIPTVLFGVSFGLIDFVEAYTLDFPDLIIMETGGMKGRREEMLKIELHQKIASAFNVPAVHSEYGMTELFSQAYSKGNGIFTTPSRLRIKTTEITDPLTTEKFGKTGLLNIIDLNNLDTCAFIQTQDLAIAYENHEFELMGRLDHADIRGCNLMVL